MLLENKILLLAPHSDDENLFCSYTLQREKPYVIIITDSWIQFNRGEGVTADQRWEESCKAADLIGYPILRLGLRDDTVTEQDITDALQKYVGVFDKVYAPMLQNGNIHHDMVHWVAKRLFGEKVVEYPTYTRTCLYTVGNKEIIPTKEEMELKHKALECYESQMRINRPHFEAMFGRSEWTF